MPDGERTNGTAATEHTAAGAEDKRREGRKGGERDTDGHAPGEWRRGTRRSTAGSRERTKKKEIYKYLRERREKNTAETRKSV